MTAAATVSRYPTPLCGNTTKDNTMTNFQMDTGGNGGSDGPWIAWSARGTLDGQIDPRSFYLRDKDGKTVFQGFKTGVVFDLAKMKTGWQRSEGVAGQAPDWRWNASISRMEPQPGDDFKKGFSIPCAIGGGKTATWEQAGASAWNAFTALVPAFQQGPGGDMLPLVRMTGTRVEQFKRGSTVTLILEVVKWVPRPDCLKEGYQAAGIATEEAAPPPAPVKAAPVAQPMPAPADGDEF